VQIPPGTGCANGTWRCLAAVIFLSGVAMAHAQTLSLDGIPGPLSWHNVPIASHIEGGKRLNISSGAKTDWFVDPFDGRLANSAPILSFTPGSSYVFHSKVQVRFASKWDAGALMLWADDHHWAKLAFELSSVRAVLRSWSRHQPRSGRYSHCPLATRNPTGWFPRARQHKDHDHRRGQGGAERLSLRVAR
jgi:hypothetical protein